MARTAGSGYSALPHTHFGTLRGCPHGRVALLRDEWCSARHAASAGGMLVVAVDVATRTTHLSHPLAGAGIAADHAVAHGRLRHRLDASRQCSARASMGACARLLPLLQQTLMVLVCAAGVLCLLPVAVKAHVVLVLEMQVDDCRVVASCTLCGDGCGVGRDARLVFFLPVTYFYSHYLATVAGHFGHPEFYGISWPITLPLILITASIFHCLTKKIQKR